jgi:translation elongation factor EF-4
MHPANAGLHNLRGSSKEAEESLDARVQVDRLHAGEVGYLAASIKAVADARVGDTITLKKGGAEESLAGYQEVLPMVFCGLFPTDADQFADLREALGRLQLNDAALQYEPEVWLPSVHCSCELACQGHSP